MKTKAYINQCIKCKNDFVANAPNAQLCIVCRTFSCKLCGKEFIVNKKQRAFSNPKFCSKACAALGRKYSNICQKCGQEFSAKNNTERYCKNCRKKKCATCGKYFTVNTAQKLKNAKYCSKACMLNDPLHLLHSRSCNICGETFKSIAANSTCLNCRTKHCEYCEKPFFVKTYKINSAKYCSVKCFDRSRMSRQWSEQDVQFIQDHFLSDMTLYELAEHFNVSKKSLYNTINRTGIQKRISLSKQDVIASIQNLFSSGISLSYSNMRRMGKGGLLKYGATHFGSWKEAITQAGIDYNVVNLYSDRLKWSTEIILETIKEIYEAGDSLQFSDIKENHPKLYSAATNNLELKSWRNALELLGIDYDLIKGTPWGTKYFSEDGNVYYSILEGKIADELFDLKNIGEIVDYSVQVRVCPERYWTCDFLLHFDGLDDLWLEVDGLRDKRDQPYILKSSSKKMGDKVVYAEKIQYYMRNNFNFKIIYDPGELYEILRAIY